MAAIITDLVDNPFQSWGVGTWQCRSLQIVTNYSSDDPATPEIEPSMPGNWLELGVGNNYVDGGVTLRNDQAILILPRWGSGVWDTFNAHEFNQHTTIEFDAVMFSEESGRPSWPMDTLIFKFGWSGTNIPEQYTARKFVDVSGLKDQVAHFSIQYNPYSDWQSFSAHQVEETGPDFYGYFVFDAKSIFSTIYLDNFSFTGAPPVPEPSAIAMLAMAGLLGLLYWRKR
jgi:hypothetical protein